MDQRSINSAEWENPDNWTGPKWLSIYSSPQDTRVWVPKQIPALGWTINVAHRKGKLWLAAVLAAALAIIVLSNVILAKLVI